MKQDCHGDNAERNRQEEQTATRAAEGPRDSRRADDRRSPDRFKGHGVRSVCLRRTAPGRKVGRKWITTKAAVLRWIESTSTDDSLVRAIKQGKGQALSDALNSGAARIKPKT